MTNFQFLFIAFSVMPLLAACDNTVFLSDAEKRDRAIAAKRDARKLEIEKGRATIVEETDRLLAAGKTSEAVQRIHPYRQFDDPKFQDVIRRVDIQARRDRELELLASIKAAKRADLRGQLLYYLELEKLAPENKSYSEGRRHVSEALSKQMAAENKKAIAEDRAIRRKQGVSVGMTKDEVLMSSWGKPERVNSTTTGRGTREQWVYGGRSYLYFDESGRLTTIQN